MEPFYDFFFILGIILCCIYIFILYKNNKKLELSHKILITILSIFIFIFLYSYAGANNVGLLALFTFSITISSKIITPVLLFFYIKSLFINEKFILKEHKPLLVFPLMFLGLYIMPSIIVNTLYYIFNLTGHYSFIPNLAATLNLIWKTMKPLRIISDITAVFYLIISLCYFLKAKKAMKANYSYIADNDFIWIRFLLIFPLLLIAIDLIFAVLEMFTNILNGGHNTEMITSCGLVLSIILMAYFGLKQSKVLIPYFLLEPNSNNSSIKEKNISIEYNQEFVGLEKKLNHIFEIERPYLNTDLTLGELAKKAGTTDKKMSALLNQHLQISFYEFINNYRVKAFKNAIQEHQYKDYTIEAISMECGFKSKTSFYRIFKSQTSMSPSEYIKSIN